MKTPKQIINYLRVNNLWDAYERNCRDAHTDPKEVIKDEGIRCLCNGFIWLITPEGVDQWIYENIRFSKWFLAESTPLKVIRYKDGAVTLTGVNSNPTMAGVHFANAEQAREWLAKNHEYEVDYNDLMGVNTEC